ncbi:cytochrome c oxidase assembly protein [Frigoribacterium sp. CG_9.8]|uniref:cytochrome c oxidase assembly protein n=1 Tax=Frigoribacterium sp. CG_9.8 TaxID=2787733 RepID=UPI0018CB9724|nr:cytochrome c oxidase assembly protein [Frigoribacterium sp. CG_9.8]MBG6106887.1 cytochrome c oxidase assembly factor CtaG [Frigoribacterium sp. CG_9.8]
MRGGLCVRAGGLSAWRGRLRAARTSTPPPCRIEPATPSVVVVLSTWRFDVVSVIVIVLAGGLYIAGVMSLRRRNIVWPGIRIIWFFALGLGSFAVVNLGFLGVWSTDMRWAFTTRIALLLFAVPGLLSMGAPVALARLVLTGGSLRRMNTVLGSWPVRLAGNAVFAPLFALVAFSVFLTPLAGSLRESSFAGSVLTVAVPQMGLLMVLPIIENTTQRTSFFITVEFLLVFVELVVDAIPGILLRLNNHILDGLGQAAGALPAWFPSAYHDQHLSGDLLWFIAEVADVPVLILLFVRWSRIDRSEAKALDALTDDEMDALTREHLRRPRE